MRVPSRKLPHVRFFGTCSARSNICCVRHFKFQAPVPNFAKNWNAEHRRPKRTPVTLMESGGRMGVMCKYENFKKLKGKTYHQ